MPYRFGDVIVVPFPFTNHTATKKRPAVVVSSEAYQRERPDIILMAITSQVRPTPTIGEATVAHWQAAGLLKPSVIKPLLATVEANLIIRQLGKLHTDDQATLRQMLGTILG
ncbi:MAG: type II toxin-antitoxin system PemK/MazF family toxin [Polyangia bacterium]|jgi:mRNA interferase MazF